MIVTGEELISPILKVAQKYHISPAIIYGVIKAECGYNGSFEVAAARHEPGYKWLYKPESVKPTICSLATETHFQQTSIGLMQVMGAVYREYGYRGWLSNLFCNIELQLDYGCRHLASKIKRFGEPKGVSAYNAGSPTNANAAYVSRVIAYSKEWPTLSGKA